MLTTPIRSHNYAKIQSQRQNVCKFLSISLFFSECCCVFELRINFIKSKTIFREGKKCDQCTKFIGCKEGSCTYPFQCNCNKGWTGKLCNKGKYNQFFLCITFYFWTVWHIMQAQLFLPLLPSPTIHLSTMFFHWAAVLLNFITPLWWRENFQVVLDKD